MVACFVMPGALPFPEPIPFEPETYSATASHERNEKDEDVPGEDDLLRESPANIVERARQFMTIKELLTATALGTS